MDPISLIVTAIVTGAATGAAEEAIKQAFENLKQLLASRHSGINLDAVERKPTSQLKRDSLAEDLKESGADSDPEILSAAQMVLNRVKERNPLLPEGLGIDIDFLQAGGSIEIENETSGDGIRGRNWTADKNIRIKNRSGGLNDPNS